MNDEERYLFDLNGYLVLPGVLGTAELSALHEAVDRHASAIRERGPAESLSGGAAPLQGARGRGELQGMLSWERPWRDPFVGLLAHARIVPCLFELLGPGFRLDHEPLLLASRPGAEGMLLHGAPGREFDPTLYYLFRNGHGHSGLLVVEWLLSDVGSEDGGLCVIPGSHKANLACPVPITRLERHRDLVRPVPARAGDVILFTEALTHGTLPWRGRSERRTLLFRYSPPTQAHSREYLPVWGAARLPELTPAQRAVLEPPYHPRLDRPVLGPDGVERRGL